MLRTALAITAAIGIATAGAAPALAAPAGPAPNESAETYEYPSVYPGEAAPDAWNGAMNQPSDEYSGDPDAEQADAMSSAGDGISAADDGAPDDGGYIQDEWMSPIPPLPPGDRCYGPECNT
ncbi:MAG: hypothetical protein AB7F96_18480 [Beijerinckiaceae bacterium]